MNMRQIFERAAAGHDTIEVGASRWPVPRSVAHLCTPAATLSTLHGLVLGGDQCPCGEPVEANSLCPACGRPYQTPCCTDGCGQYVQPEKRSSTGWYPPPCACADCRSASAQALLKSRLEYIPRRLKDGANDYERRDGRRDTDYMLRRWVQAGPKGAVWISGARKSGKSTSAARAVIKSIMSEHVGSVMWLEYEDLVSAAKRCFQDDSSRQWALIDKANQVELLVLDDLFPAVRKMSSGKILGVERLSGYAAQTLCDLLRRRLGLEKPTIVTSAHTPGEALGHLGEHVLSWWCGVGQHGHIEA